MGTHIRPAVAGLSTFLLGGLLAPAAALAIVTPRTVDMLTGALTDHAQSVQMSGDGNVVMYHSTSRIPSVTDAIASGGFVYAVNLTTGQTVHVNTDSNSRHTGFGMPGGMSYDGRYVTYTDNEEISLRYAAFVRDLTTGTTEQVSNAIGPGGLDEYVDPGAVDISDDGRYVVYSTRASNLLPPGEDTNGKTDVFLYDRNTATTTRVTHDLNNADADGDNAGGDSYAVSISGDGSTIVFVSSAPDLVAGDTNGVADIFAVDRVSLVAERISVDTNENQGLGASGSNRIGVSANGRVIAFASTAELVLPDTTGATDIFVRDRDAGTTTRVSDKDGAAGQGGYWDHSIDPVISADGTKVAFASLAQLVSPSDGNVRWDVYLTNRLTNQTELISRTPAGIAGNDESGVSPNGVGIAMNALGSVMAFDSRASNLGPDTDGGQLDVFISRPAPADTDGDGIANDVDTEPSVFSNVIVHGTLTATITNRNGNTFFITAAAGVPNAIHMTASGGTGKPKLTACGKNTAYNLPANVIIKCGSVIHTVDIDSGAAEVEIIPDFAYVSISGGTEAEVEVTAGGGYTVENVVGGSVTVVIGSTTSTVDPGETASGSAYVFDGFKAPVDNGGVLNSLKAGRTVPIRWHLADATGAPITNLATATLAVTSLSCPAGSTPDQVEEFTTGSTGLMNLGNGNYQLNWATPASYASSCKTLHLNIGDGADHVALFQFTR